MMSGEDSFALGGGAGDGYGWSGHGIDGDGDDDGMAGLGDPTVPTLQLPGGQIIPLPDLGGALALPGGNIPGLPPSGPSGPPGIPQAPPVSLQTGNQGQIISGIDNKVTLIGAMALAVGLGFLLSRK